MSDGYTVVNLKDVKDSAPDFGFSPALEARFAAGDLGLERSAVSYQRLQPEQRVPFAHRHKEQEELYVVLSGSGHIEIDDVKVPLRVLDAVRIPAERVRTVAAGPEGIEILAFGAPATGMGDAEMVSPPD